MRLALIGGCLESGRDGVGDYLAQVAEAATRCGATVARIGLTDLLDSAEPSLLRLDRNRPWSARRDRAQAFLRDFAPDWVSWHLVPYAHNPKGVLPSALAQLAPPGLLRAHRHVFLHELWIGAEAGAPLRSRLWRMLQRPRLLGFLRRWQPRLIDTSNPTYQELLARAGVSAGVRPLFGNIPPALPPPSSPAIADPTRPLVVAFFGTLHPTWDPAPTATFLQQVARCHNRPVQVVGLGRIGPHGDAAFRSWPPPLIASVTGPLPPERISEHLHAADVAVATHPWALLGKSGVVAACLDHGLPVVVPRDDWHLPGTPAGAPPLPPLAPGIARLADLSPAGFPAWIAAHRRPPAWRRDALVRAWLDDLARALPSSPP